MTDTHILTRTTMCLAAIAALTMTSIAAQAEQRLSAGVSKSAQQRLITVAEQHFERERAKQSSQVDGTITRLTRNLAPRQKEWQRAFQADRRSSAFQRDLQAADKQIAAATTVTQRRAAIDAHAKVYDRYSDLLSDVRRNAPATDTAQLRDELARSLGVRPSDLGGNRDVVVYDARRAADAEPSSRAPNRREQAPPANILTLEPPFSLVSSGREPDEPLGGGTYGYTMSAAYDEFPAQAISWSTANVSFPGGIATTSGWARVGETFTVPSGFTRLRVTARIELANDQVHFLPSMFGPLGAVREVITLDVIGPDQLFEYATLTLNDIVIASSYTPDPSTALLSSDGSVASTGPLDRPLALEFDIPVTGGEFSVAYGVDSWASAAASVGSVIVDAGSLAVHVIAFEIEAFE